MKFKDTLQIKKKKKNFPHFLGNSSYPFKSPEDFANLVPRPDTQTKDIKIFLDKTQVTMYS